jgi:hypothetical protein
MKDGVRLGLKEMKDGVRVGLKEIRRDIVD